MAGTQTHNIFRHLQSETDSLRQNGLYKEERPIESPQGGHIRCGGEDVLNFCANNYLGLSNHPQLVQAARQALGERGYGMSSVRFICGTQDIHCRLEQKISAFLTSFPTGSIGMDGKVMDRSVGGCHAAADIVTAVCSSVRTTRGLPVCP